MIEEYLDKDEKYTILEECPKLIITSKGKIFEENKDTFNRVNTFIFQNTYEYVIINDYKNNTHKFYIQDLVFSCFKSGFDSRFFKIVHKNGNTLDNRIDNLRIEFIRKNKFFIEKYEDTINDLLEESFMEA